MPMTELERLKHELEHTRAVLGEDYFKLEEALRELAEFKGPSTLPERDLSTWIQTFTGKQFWPLNPRIEDIDIRDIAHALSNECRYNGHSRVFYSVAQHSVIVSKMVAPELAMEALLHDASEAYLKDLPKPLKRFGPLAKVYGPVEARLEAAIRERFGLPAELNEAIKTADRAILAAERRVLHRPPPVPWIDNEPCDIAIHPLPPVLAEREFLARYAELRLLNQPTDVVIEMRHIDEPAAPEELQRIAQGFADDGITPEDLQPPKRAASVVAFNRAGQVLVSPWKRDLSKVTLPGGKSDGWEQHFEIAIREFAEETGYHLDPLRLVPVLQRDYDGRDYVGYVTTEDLSDIRFEPGPGESMPYWADREVLTDPARCPYGEFTKAEWLFLSDALGYKPRPAEASNGGCS